MLASNSSDCQITLITGSVCAEFYQNQNGKKSLSFRWLRGLYTFLTIYIKQIELTEKKSFSSTDETPRCSNNRLLIRICSLPLFMPRKYCFHSSLDDRLITRLSAIRWKWTFMILSYQLNRSTDVSNAIVKNQTLCLSLIMLRATHKLSSDTWIYPIVRFTRLAASLIPLPF